MTKNILSPEEKKIRRLMEDQKKLLLQKEALTNLCLILMTVLGITLILI